MLNLIFYKKMRTQILIIASVLLFLTNMAHAGTFADWMNNFLGSSSANTIGSMFANLDSSLRVGIAVIKFFSIAIGLIFVFNAALKLIRFSDGKSEIKESVYALIAGIAMVSFVPVIDILSNTLTVGNQAFGLDKVCDYSFDGCPQTQSLEEHSKAALVGIVTFIRFLGFIGVAHGISILHSLGKNGGGNKSISSAITFIIGGVLCINAVGAAIIIGNTMAPGSGFVEFFRDSEIGKAIAP